LECIASISHELKFFAAAPIFLPLLWVTSGAKGGGREEDRKAVTEEEMEESRENIRKEDRRRACV
jgi:hypothetical protein